MADDDVDFAVAAYRDQGVWQVAELKAGVTQDVGELVEALRRFPSDVGVLGMVAVDEEFFILVRVSGPYTRFMLSDVTTVPDYDLAADVADQLDLADPASDADADPAGDLDIVSDLGLSGSELDLLCDPDAYPDETLLEIAERLGFGDELNALVG
jgi:putative tRNA adenosine deaminase-associated protein